MYICIHVYIHVKIYTQTCLHTHRGHTLNNPCILWGGMGGWTFQSGWESLGCWCFRGEVRCDRGGGHTGRGCIAGSPNALPCPLHNRPTAQLPNCPLLLTAPQLDNSSRVSPGRPRQPVTPRGRLVDCPAGHLAGAREAHGPPYKAQKLGGTLGDDTTEKHGECASPAR